MFSFRPFQLIPAPLIRPCGWGSKVFPGIAALVLIANPACSEESSPQDPPRQTYLSDTDRTACYLETIQKPNFLGKQTWQSDLDKKKISDLKNELVRRGFNPDEIDRLLRDGLTTAVSTRFENPLAIKILQKLVEEVETALPKVDLTSPGKVLYGSMSTKSVNAEVVDVPPGWTCHKPEAASSIFASRILLVNTSALTYAHETTKVLISTIPIEEKNGGIALKLGSDELTRQLQESSEAKDAFVENFLEFEQIAAKTPFFIDKKYTAFLSPIRDAIELFVVAHEYSHIALNHKRETPNSPFSWKQELEADYYGFNVMGAAIFQNPKHPKEFRLMQLLSPMLFLRTQELLENSKQVYRCIRREHWTHEYSSRWTNAAAQ